ncbi:hypothetical protein O1L55_39090 [Streptomyces albulus]|nr:hypothetical protein [Streptomyces noursei]
MHTAPQLGHLVPAVARQRVRVRRLPAAIRRAAAALNRSRRDNRCATNHDTTAISTTVPHPAISSARSSATCAGSSSEYAADTDSERVGRSPSPPTPVAAHTRGSSPPLRYVPDRLWNTASRSGDGSVASSNCAPSANVPSRS